MTSVLPHQLLLEEIAPIAKILKPKYKNRGNILGAYIIAHLDVCKNIPIPIGMLVLICDTRGTASRYLIIRVDMIPVNKLEYILHKAPRIAFCLQRVLMMDMPFRIKIQESRVGDILYPGIS